MKGEGGGCSNYGWFLKEESFTLKFFPNHEENLLDIKNTTLIQFFDLSRNVAQ